MNDRSSRDQYSDRDPRKGGRNEQGSGGHGRARGGDGAGRSSRDSERGRSNDRRNDNWGARGRRSGGDGEHRGGGAPGQNRREFRPRSDESHGDRPRREEYRDRRDRDSRSRDRNFRDQKPYRHGSDDRPRRRFDDHSDRGGERGGDRTDRERRPYQQRDEGGRKRFSDRDDRARENYRPRNDGERGRSTSSGESRGRNDERGQRGNGGRHWNEQRSSDRQVGGRDRGERRYNDREQGGRDRGERRSNDRQPRRGEDGGRQRGQRSFTERNDRGAQRGGSPARGGTRGGGRSDRGGSAREFTEAERLQHELRPVRSEHQDPWIPAEIEPKDLYPSARNELKTLQEDVQERVARHLATVLMLLDEDPVLAHEHAISASRRAGRIPVAREFLAVTAYRVGDYALALRELRTYRRLSGRDDRVALMVECERALARPEKAIETGLEINSSNLDTEHRVHLAIAMSGARLDLGQAQQALFELEIPELDPDRGFAWSPELFAAYAAVLEELGRDADAEVWKQHALRAERALEQHFGGTDEIEVVEIYEQELEAEHSEESVAAAEPEPEHKPEQARASESEPEQAPDPDSEHEPQQHAADAADATNSGIERQPNTVTQADATGAGAGTPSASRAGESQSAADDSPASFEDEIAAEVDELLAEAGITSSVDEGESNSTTVAATEEPSDSPTEKGITKGDAR